MDDEPSIIPKSSTLAISSTVSRLDPTKSKKQLAFHTVKSHVTPPTSSTSLTTTTAAAAKAPITSTFMHASSSLSSSILSSIHT